MGMRQVGAVLMGVLVTASALAAEDSPLLAGRDVERPPRLHYTPPDQSLANTARVRTLILLEATLDTQGRPTAAKILRGMPMLDRPAMDALKTWRYEPTLVEGVPKSVRLIEGVEFLYGESELPDLYATLARDRSWSSDVRLYAILRLQQFPPKSRKIVIKTLQKLQADKDALVAKAATTALGVLQGSP